jgi:putative phosphoesterase
VEIVVIADSHLPAGAPGRLPAPLYDALGEADLVLHAGDVVSTDLLAELRSFAPVHAVLGNNDVTLIGQLPETIELELDGVRVAMIHDSGARQGRARRMRRRFPDADLVVFGHSHQPVDEPGEDGQRLFNPGSPTQRRRAPHPSFGRVRLDDGTIERHEVVALPVRGARRGASALRGREPS